MSVRLTAEAVDLPIKVFKVRLGRHFVWDGLDRNGPVSTGGGLDDFLRSPVLVEGVHPLVGLSPALPA